MRISLSDAQCQNILLVGGFAESPYACSKIMEWASKFNGLDISKPDHVLSKAIPHGALSWYTHSAVQTKIAKFHYGAETDLEFDPNNPDMVGRQAFKNILGEWRIRGGWKSIVEKVEQYPSPPLFALNNIYFPFPGRENSRD